MSPAIRMALLLVVAISTGALLSAASMIAPANAQIKSKQPQAVPCDCTNCSAQHCQPPKGGKGGGGDIGQQLQFQLQESNKKAPPKMKAAP